MSASEPLKRSRKLGLYSFLLLLILFGAWVEIRGAYQHTRKTDAGVYLRAGWAARTGSDIYSISDDRGLHYVYPPLLALAMIPLADPPCGQSRAGYLPYEVSIGIWYVLTLMIGFSGGHILAKALEETSDDTIVQGQPPFCRRWWALRILPILILLPAIGRSQMRGQVGLLIAFLLCGTTASLLRGKRFRAGLWLAGAISVKMIPAFLLLLPLGRRDWKMLSGTAIGLMVGMILIPVCMMGPYRTMAAYESFYQEVLLPGISADTEGSRGKELTGITSTDSNAPMAVLHNIMYPRRENRPNLIATSVRIAHWIIAGLLTIITLYATGTKKAGRWFTGRIEATPTEAMSLGALLLVMFIASPVFHPHYVSMAIPLVTVMISVIWDRHSYTNFPIGWKLLFGFLILSHALTSIDRGLFFFLRDFGLVLLSTLLLWGGTIFLIYSNPLK